MLNKFSLPMPYNKKLIDSLLDENNKLEKSRITSFYFSLPSSCNLFTVFEQQRNDYVEYPDFSYWKDLIKYSLDKGVDFIYNLNNPKNIQIESADFQLELEKLDTLLNELKSTGVDKLRVANHKLISYLNGNYKHFKLYASTSFEYKLIKEYLHFMQIHPFIQQIVPSCDVNKNFELLKNLRKFNNQIDIEIIVNEGCVGGCAMRYDHSCEVLKNSALKNKFCEELYSKLCADTVFENPLLYLCKSPVIYPWEISEYNKIGIYNFKLAGREDFKRDMQKSINSYILYLRGVDNIKNIENESINSIIHHIANIKLFENFKIKDIKPLLPNVKHYVKSGHLCDSICGIDCKYCYKCAEKIKKVLGKKISKISKQPHYVQACRIT